VRQLVGFEIIVLGMVPVYNRVIEANLQTLFANSVHNLPTEVTAYEVMGIVGGVFGVEQTEAVMVFGSEDNVSTSGFTSESRPLTGKILLRTKQRNRLVSIFPCVRTDALLNPFHAASFTDRLALPRSSQARV
jgi:hypothetical protein